MQLLLKIITIAVIFNSIILLILANLIDKNMRMGAVYQVQLKIVFILLGIIVGNVIGVALYWLN